MQNIQARVENAVPLIPPQAEDGVHITHSRDALLSGYESTTPPYGASIFLRSMTQDFAEVAPHFDGLAWTLSEIFKRYDGHMTLSLGGLQEVMKDLSGNQHKAAQYILDDMEAMKAFGVFGAPLLRVMPCKEVPEAGLAIPQFPHFDDGHALVSAYNIAGTGYTNKAGISGVEMGNHYLLREDAEINSLNVGDMVVFGPDAPHWAPNIPERDPDSSAPNAPRLNLFCNLSN